MNGLELKNINKLNIMWSILIGVVLVFIIIMAIINIRSLVRKMKANPSNWIDLGIGILIWGTAIVLLTIELFKYIN